MDMREHHLGYRETARKYKLTVTSESSAATTIRRWERLYLEVGAEGLIKARLFRRRNKQRQTTKLDKKVEEDLIAENQRLRTEIEYLISGLARRTCYYYLKHPDTDKYEKEK